MISEIVPTDNLLTRAEEILIGINKMAPLAISSAMTVIDAGYDLSLPDALELEAVHFGMLCGSADKQVGVTAFLEKRAAEFTGK